jgi:hypothetical protein
VSINPYYMKSFQQWAEFMVPTLEIYGVISNPPAESDWQEWASGVVSLDGLVSRAAPMPYGFASWRDWAARLIEVLDDGF